MNERTATARRLYHHVLNGGHLEASDVAHLVQCLEIADAEIERLRSALSKIADTDPDEGTAWFHDVANDALKEDHT